MDQTIREAYDASRSLDDKPFGCACYVPYTSLYFDTTGDVIACCKNTSYVLGNVARDRLDDIWRGRRNQALRKALASYNFNLGCEFCEWQIEGRQFDQVHARVYDHLPVAGDAPEWPVNMDFTISNTCNLACIMCYGTLSSTIRAHRENLPPLPKVYGDQFFADLRRYLPHLRSAMFMGGEPYLAQENYRIWDMMIEDGVAFPCKVITNGTQWNGKVERVLDALEFHVAISMDGTTKETVEAVRVNANFEKLRDNVVRFREYARDKGTRMHLMYCLMRQNWHEYGDYLRFADELDVDVQMNVVIDPSHTSLYTLPPAELLEIADRMDRQDAERGYSSLPRNGHLWQSAVHALRDNATERQVQGVGQVKEASRARKERKDHLASAWKRVGEGRLDAALAEIAEIAEHDPQAYEAALCEAEILRNLGRFDGCEAALDRAIALWRKSPRAWIQRAWLRLAQNRIEDGVADAQTARGLLSSDQAELAAGVRHVLAHLHQRLGQLDLALAEIREIPDDHAAAYDARLTEAWLLRELGRFDESGRAVDVALEQRPGDPRGWVERAWLRLAQDRPADAQTDAEHARTLTETGENASLAPSVYHVMSVLLARQERFADALAWADKLLEHRSGDPGLFVNRAYIHQALGQHREALADAERALALRADHGEASALAARAREQLARAS